ncbi:hypothetical protein C798_25200 [Herbaspirillum rubrisubalbicans Os34]|uniref:Tyrosine specific protein phosphatases domain-containing protein n=1 Tax=Herbaspirillum rubrisubalbicans Os34 TaxID=1235827 RepID=A0A6M3ZYL5_9BURK|nr:hypothetical protein [Herbaspirillum rubrisubalbicans]QJQ03411.1 hypothetical protein C798_25200 [Herbaspirillum rubrisubalbicans Os34]
MPAQLHQVLDAIFRFAAAGSQRQVIAVPRAVAQQLPLVENLAVVSITAPEKEQAALAPFEHVLRLSFADIDFLSNDMSQRSKAKLKDAFTAEQAREVITFINKLPATIATIVVHCEGGYSRSCAIAKALHHIYGYEVRREDLKEMNPSVLAVMLKVAMEKQKAP